MPDSELVLSTNPTALKREAKSTGRYVIGILVIWIISLLLYLFAGADARFLPGILFLPIVILMMRKAQSQYLDEVNNVRNVLSVRKDGLYFFETKDLVKWEDLKYVAFNRHGNLSFWQKGRLFELYSIRHAFFGKEKMFQAARFVKKYAPPKKTKYLKEKLINKY